MTQKCTLSSATETAMRGLTRKLMSDRFTETQAIWVEEHLKLLCDLRRILGNDLDKAIILGVIGQRMLRSAIAGTHSHATAISGIDNVAEARLTNIESVASAAGLPRESVRRKVHELIDDGWLRRTDCGGLAIEPACSVALQSSTRIAIDGLDLVFARFAGMMAAEGWLSLEVPTPAITAEDPAREQQVVG